MPLVKHSKKLEKKFVHLNFFVLDTSIVQLAKTLTGRAVLCSQPPQEFIFQFDVLWEGGGGGGGQDRTSIDVPWRVNRYTSGRLPNLTYHGKLKKMAVRQK